MGSGSSSLHVAVVEEAATTIPHEAAGHPGLPPSRSTLQPPQRWRW